MVTNFSDQGAGGWKPELRKAAEVEARRLNRSCAKRRKGCRKVILWLEEVTGADRRDGAPGLFPKSLPG